MRGVQWCCGGVFEVAVFSDGHAWFRMFGYGLSVRPESTGLLFSEREGYARYVVWCRRIIRVLVP